MPFPQDRLRRLRATAGFRRLVRETRLSVDNLIAPFFVMEGRDVRQPIGAMPGQWRVSVDHLIKDAGEVHALGVPAILLFGIPDRKSTRLNSSHANISYAVFCLEKKQRGQCDRI